MPDGSDTPASAISQLGAIARQEVQRYSFGMVMSFVAEPPVDEAWVDQGSKRAFGPATPAECHAWMNERIGRAIAERLKAYANG